MANFDVFFQDGLTGSACGDRDRYAVSHLRRQVKTALSALESVLGTLPPVSLWAPLGFTSGGHEADFKRRRASENRHRRVAMLATMVFERLAKEAFIGMFFQHGLTYDGIQVKHGRIAMLAMRGCVTPELFGWFPGCLSPSRGPNSADDPIGLEAIAKVPALG